MQKFNNKTLIFLVCIVMTLFITAEFCFAQETQKNPPVEKKEVSKDELPLQNDESLADYKPFEPFKMVFLPDIHLSFNNEEENWILHKESLAIFQDVIRQINKDSAIKFVVFGGDLINNDNEKFGDLDMFLESATDLNPKYYVVLGDREADFSDENSKFDFTKEFDEFKLDTANQTFWSAEPVKDVLLIGLDSSQEKQSFGYVNLQQLFWLDNTLKNNRDKFTIIVLHHPPLITEEMDKTGWQRFSLRKPELISQIINLYPQVKIILSGHHHSNFAKGINGKLYITAPSVVTYPNSFKVLTVYPDRVEVDNKKISFKQIIKKSRKNLLNSSYAKELNPKNPEKIIKYQEGNSFSRKKKYIFNELY